MLAILILFWMPTAHAEINNCGYIQCYDQCTGSYRGFKGDQCQKAFDPSRGCYRAYATCGGNNPGPGQCRGRTLYCYDYCSRRSLKFNDVNRCTRVWDYTRACFAAGAECR